ncbi:RNA polymerase-binding transcription factor DksA [Allocatelliglobosispora scoriae]|uniref:RNA polymerase-binding transcription factor DksA n=1 Tax=Allocatelliglobosispora scoriae TaxID=643052 RepID=A0A841BN99_9ACTN|nr:TraR/DksA C4-type zinc finger protein [Allocatelliglobosispora scoriae]MBB5868858.1 RNA polymerase-binding transcription factor DksA [Allocatelliglobosispora scoriae]
MTTMREAPALPDSRTDRLHTGENDPAVILMQRYAEVDEEYQVQLSVLAGLRQGLGDDTGDIADGGSKATDLDTEEILTERLRQRRESLSAAMERAARGTYGRCDGCRLPIATERLLAAPAALLCVPCQVKAERAHL